VAKPWNTDAFGYAHPLNPSPDCVDSADDFVSGDDRHLRLGQLAINHVQVRAANAAGTHLDSNLPWPGLSLGQFGPFQRGLEFL
jgi:hypothetical protein